MKSHMYYFKRDRKYKKESEKVLQMAYETDVIECIQVGLISRPIQPREKTVSETDNRNFLN